MENGTTREVELDLDFDGEPETTGHLRIANLSPCENGETSETACGLVLEFTDIISIHRMNKYNNSGNSNGDGSKGGWKYSDMRAYLNGGIYLEGQIGETDYTDAGVIDALPSDLRTKIIPTTVISGYTTLKDTENFVTEDYLYLFSTKEIYGESWNDTVTGNETPPITKQLDYYEHIEVTLSNYQGVKKSYDNNYIYMWLRSSHSQGINSFLCISNSGMRCGNTCTSNNGVSPAFRIAAQNS